MPGAAPSLADAGAWVLVTCAGLAVLFVAAVVAVAWSGRRRSP